jgi:DNA-binding protein Fis
VFGSAGPAPAASLPGWIDEAISLLPDGLGLPEALSGMEEAILRKAMDWGDGVQSRAADLLGLRRNVFKYKWDKYADSAPTAVSDTLSGTAPTGGDLASVLAAFEEEILRRALALAGGNQALAADLLGLKRNVMPYKLKKFSGLLKERSS